ncbi:MAG: flagellar biosynthesis protein FliQ [Alphaproteobacteria bacterium]|nr:flagellar biosynthesis protein FliQ [Alphaproteobacteria bacterium]
MDELQVIDLGRDAVWTMLKVSGPILLVGLAVGLSISVFQTLTHIQEMTLTFIPKIVAVFTSLILFMPWMLTQLNEFMMRVMDKIISLP